MKRTKYIIPFAIIIVAMFFAASCSKNLDVLPENRTFTAETDYTKTSDMINPLLGVYAGMSVTDGEWEDFPIIGVRGDDVNAGGGSDQPDLAATDKYNYNRTFWALNTFWEAYYQHLFASQSAMEQIALFKAKISYLLTSLTVKRTCWLISQNYRTAIHKRPRNADALLLTSRELVRMMLYPVAKAEVQ